MIYFYTDDEKAHAPSGSLYYKIILPAARVKIWRHKIKIAKTGGLGSTENI